MNTLINSGKYNTNWVHSQRSLSPELHTLTSGENGLLRKAIPTKRTIFILFKVKVIRKINFEKRLLFHD